MTDLELLVSKLVEPKKGIMLFVKSFLSHMTPCNIPDFHEQIYNLLTNENRLALAAPRSFAKVQLSLLSIPSLEVSQKYS